MGCEGGGCTEYLQRVLDRDVNRLKIWRGVRRLKG